ncbi:MAG: hypothetical protein IPH45_14285 [Bacteroidales bacterium]|nr:hypothetical protein [Bacteroidales bacterium]
MKKAIILCTLFLAAIISSIPAELSIQISSKVFTGQPFGMESTIGHGVAILLILSAGYSIAKNFMLNKDEQESHDGMNN